MKPQCTRYLLICDKLCIIGKIVMGQGLETDRNVCTCKGCHLASLHQQSL